MQPYFLPYIGYWQLIGAVDRFVLLDDVNYIVRGYINRNRILLEGKPYPFTIPIKKASQNKLICDTKLCFGTKEKRKFLQTIQNAYRKKTYFGEVMPLVERIIDCSEEDLTQYIMNSIQIILGYLDIRTELYISSKLKKKQGMKAEERILEICKVMEADIYINPSGGRRLYVGEHFERENIKLFFINMIAEQVIYDQSSIAFEENLSIIDVLMFNDKKKVQGFLKEYELHE
ncbi:hypothetical protein D3Z55_20950 [Clostridiaceae bacterium]|nr:hypothetical protein [Clostridiaceae bacterium]